MLSRMLHQVLLNISLRVMPASGLHRHVMHVMSAAHVIPVTSAKRIMPVMSAMPIKRIMIIIFCRAAKHTKRVLQACKQIQGRDVKRTKKRTQSVVSDFVSVTEYGLTIFFTLFQTWAWHHDLMAAFKAFDPEVRACSHTSTVCSRMGASEFDDISKTVPVRHQ